MKKILFFVSLCCVLVFAAGCLGVGESKKGEVTGVVVDAKTAEPLPNITLTLANQTASTDTLGKFTFKNVSPGKQTLEVSSENYFRKEIALTIEAEKILNLEVQLEHITEVQIVGKLLDNNNTPLPNREIKFSNAKHNYSVTTDELGNYSLTIWPGEYIVHAERMYGSIKAFTDLPVSILGGRELNVYILKESTWLSLSQDIIGNLRWAAFQIGAAMRYTVTVSKVNTAFQIPIFIGNTINTTLEIGQMDNFSTYYIKFEAYANEQKVLQFEEKYAVVIPTEEYIEEAQYFFSRYEDAANEGKFETFADLIADNYKDNLGRNKTGLMRELKQSITEKNTYFMLSNLVVYDTTELDGHVLLTGKVDAKYWVKDMTTGALRLYKVQYTLARQDNETKLVSANYQFVQ